MPTPRPPRPPMPRAARFLLWLTGAIALLLLFAPALYVVKYYGGDKAREDRHAAQISLAFIKEPDVNTVAPVLSPPASGNAALFYARAMQSYAARTHGQTLPPTPAEAQLIMDGGRRAQCQFFGAGLPAFQDPQGGAILYEFPAAPDEKSHYLSAAVRLSAGLAQSVPPAQRAAVGRALVRFGAGLGRERATRVHVAVSTLVQKQGLRLLLASPTPALYPYVDARQLFDEAVQSKYALLEPDTANNLALQERVARADADPLWRREGVWAAWGTLSRPRFAWRYPLEAVHAKATLADIANHDAAPSVRAAASEALARLAQNGGAVIRR